MRGPIRRSARRTPGTSRSRRAGWAAGTAASAPRCRTASTAGATSEKPQEMWPSGAPSDASSWLNTYCCSRLKPAPPCSFGQPRAAQPFSTSFACHTAMVGRSMGMPRRKRSRTSAGRFSRMKVRTSVRNAARSGWKSKFTCRCRPAAGRGLARAPSRPWIAGCVGLPEPAGPIHAAASGAAWDCGCPKTVDSRLRGNDGNSASHVIPAKAGIHDCRQSGSRPASYAIA